MRLFIKHTLLLKYTNVHSMVTCWVFKVIPFILFHQGKCLLWRPAVMQEMAGRRFPLCDLLPNLINFMHRSRGEDPLMEK